MIRQKTDDYIKTCMKAWLFCESCSVTEMNSMTPRYDLIIECNACAEACFNVITALLNKSDDIGDLPFNCMVHCWQCVEECNKYKKEPTIEACIAACTTCARKVKELTIFSSN